MEFDKWLALSGHLSISIIGLFSQKSMIASPTKQVQAAIDRYSYSHRPSLVLRSTLLRDDGPPADPAPSVWELHVPFHLHSLPGSRFCHQRQALALLHAQMK